MAFRIEFLADGIDFGQSVLFECLTQLLEGQIRAFDEFGNVRRISFPSGVEPHFQAVFDAQQVFGELFQGELAGVFHIPLGPAAEVFHLGLGAQKLIPVFHGLGLGGGQLLFRRGFGLGFRLGVVAVGSGDIGDAFGFGLSFRRGVRRGSTGLFLFRHGGL